MEALSIATLKKTGLDLIRLLTGALYVFAGFVKLVDPVGAKIKLSEYLEAFGLEFLLPIALLLGVLAALLEFTLGWALILKFFKKTIVLSVAVLTVFFTLLTFVLALRNPVSDCGCFGDAIKLTNWETFFKNLVLLAMVAILYFNRKVLWQPKDKYKQWYLLVLTVCMGIYVPHYSYYHLPIIDFRPFAVGNHIPTLMKVPEGAPVDEFKSVLYYSKNGEVKEFTEDNYPWQDSTWTFVEMKSELLTKGAEPMINDFVIDHLQKGEITNEVLNSSEYQYLMIAPKIEGVLKSERLRFMNVSEWLAKNGKELLVLTASSDDEIKYFEQKALVPWSIANVDETVLKTMARKNPTLMILKDGFVIGKYTSKDLPHKDEILDPLGFELRKARRDKSKLIVLYLLLIFGAGIGLSRIKLN